MSLRYRTGETARALAVSGFLGLAAVAALAARPRPQEATPGTRSESRSSEVAIEPAPVAYGSPLEELRAVIPELPGMALTPLGSLRANENPMQVAVGETTWPPAQVLRFYAEVFSRAGRTPRVEHDARGGGAVSYFDAERGRLVSVMATPTGAPDRPVTMVFPVITEARDGVKLTAELPRHLPSAPGAVTVLRLDEPRPGPAPLSSTVTQLAPGAPAELAAFYREALIRAGYVVKGQRSTIETEWLELEQHGERVQLTISRTKPDAKSSTVAFVLEGNP